MWERLPGKREQYAREEADGTTTVISRREYDRLRQTGEREPRNVIARFAPDEQPVQVPGRAVRVPTIPTDAYVPIIADVKEHEKAHTTWFSFDVTEHVNAYLFALEMQDEDEEDLAEQFEAPLREALDVIAAENRTAGYWFLNVEYLEEGGGADADAPVYNRKAFRTKAYGIGDDTIIEAVSDKFREYKVRFIVSAQVVVVYLD